VLPKEIGELSRLKELHIQSNRLTVLPPELGMIPLCITALHVCTSDMTTAVLCHCSRTFTDGVDINL